MRKTCRKLIPKADGTYLVVVATDNIVTIICVGMTENVSRDRIAKATHLPHRPQLAAK